MNKKTIGAGEECKERDAANLKIIGKKVVYLWRLCKWENVLDLETGKVDCFKYSYFLCFIL